MAKFIVYQGEDRVLITTKAKEEMFNFTMVEDGVDLKDYDRSVIGGCCVEVEYNAFLVS